MVYNGTTVTDICVYPGQTVSWQEAEQNAEFAVNFLSTPFTTNQYLFQGSSGTPTSGTVANGLGYPCFKFTIRQQVGPTIYPADPKVVVHGVGDVGGETEEARRRADHGRAAATAAVIDHEVGELRDLRPGATSGLHGCGASSDSCRRALQITPVRAKSVSQ